MHDYDLEDVSDFRFILLVNTNNQVVIHRQDYKNETSLKKYVASKSIHRKIL